VSTFALFNLFGVLVITIWLRTFLFCMCR